MRPTKSGAQISFIAINIQKIAERYKTAINKIELYLAIMLSNAIVVCRHASYPPLPVSIPPRLPLLSLPPAAATTVADAPDRSSPSASAAIAVPPPRELLLLCCSLFGIAVINATVAVAVPPPPLLPCELSLWRRYPFGIAVADAAAATAVAILSPRELLLLNLAPFGIAVIDAAAAAADADDNNDVTACPVGCIPPPRFKLRRRPPPSSTDHCRHQAIFAIAAANLIVVTLLSAAAILPCNIWSVVAAAVSCLQQTPLSSFVTLLIVTL